MVHCGQKNMEPTPPPTSGGYPPPPVGPRWSKKLILWLLFSSLFVAAAALAGFLYYQELHRPAVDDSPVSGKHLQRQQKLYTNDYWGFSFSYPSFWYPVTGSFEEGDYFFSSEPINFTQELSSDQALLEIVTFSNYRNLSFTDWLSDREKNYFPLGTILDKQALQINGYPAMRYAIKLQKPQNLIGYWDMVIISKQDKKMYEFILEAATQDVAVKFQNVFGTMVDSVKFYNGFGT